MLFMRVAWISSLFQLSCFASEPANIVRADSNSPQLITLENQTKILGLQSALTNTFTSTHRSITVFADACQDNGTKNCTAACQDPKQMFSNLSTLHNCVVYSDISNGLANNSLSADVRHLAEELNFEPNNTASSLPATISNISNTILQCLRQSCSMDSSCSRHVNAELINDAHSLCGPIPAYINADVGGIGVFISYIMQLGLALLAFVITTPWALILERLRISFGNCLRFVLPQRAPSRAKHYSWALSEPLTEALKDFQKAQCWFMLATNSAGLIIEKRGGSDPRSLQQLYNTYVFIKVIAIGGYLPITFTLFNLHMIRQLEWYPIVLSTVTIIVATILELGSSTFTPTVQDFENISSLTSTAGPASCAHQNLVPWCYAPRRDGNYFGFNASSSGSGANNILIFCLITLAIIVVDHLCRSDDPNGWTLGKSGIAPSKPIFPHAGIILYYGTIAFHFIFFGVFIYCFTIFGEDLEWFNANNVYNPSWGFGQIVAILIWMPTLFDYASAQISESVAEVIKNRAPKRNANESTIVLRALNNERPYSNLPEVGTHGMDDE